uniref:Myb-like domain-containing protein n=1 Tax=Globisporangium ultimum (strain ATCC 200006 / CBS 805.95 / DAOM BR144) TaxID=431595 RepID=K3WBM1_GLOUD
MSDFTDDEDRQLVQLALGFAAQKKLIMWEQVAALMCQSTHSKDALQQRLKTLKRTHGTDLRNFPPCTRMDEQGYEETHIQVVAVGR